MKEVGPQVVTFRASNALNAQEGGVTVEVIRAPEIQLRIKKSYLKWIGIDKLPRWQGQILRSLAVRLCEHQSILIYYILDFWPRMTLSKLDKNFLLK